MNGQRMDDLTRSLAQGVSRRTAIRGLFGSGISMLALRTTPVGAQSDKVTMCKPTGAGYKLTEVNWKQIDKRRADGYFDPYSCGDDLACEPCCVEWHEQCSSDADCCSENCLSSGFCGDLCYCHERFDPDEQATLGSMCGSSTAWECNAENPGCLSSADCGGSYTECIIAPDCNASGGACAYALSECEV